MKVKELMDSLKGDCYRFRVHYPEEWEFGLITGATFFGKASKENSMPDFSLSFPRRFPESMSGESGMAGRSGADVVIS